MTTGVGWESEKCVGNVGSIPRLGFRALCLQDSPLGVRDTDYVSAFPAGVTVASTWDRQIMRQRGFDMGTEHKLKGVDMQLGPVVGPLGRAPEGGRNWEVSGGMLSLVTCTDGTYRASLPTQPCLALPLPRLSRASKVPESLPVPSTTF